MRTKLRPKIKISADKQDAEVDVTKAVPGRIQGKLSLQGVPPPPGRLALMADGTSQAGGGFNIFLALSSGGMRGPSATIGRDGGFDLELAPGKYKLRVVDLGTGVTLLKADEPVEVEAGASNQLEQELSLELALVRVTLKPKAAEGEIAAAKLEVKINWPKSQPGGLGGFIVHDFEGAPGGTGPGVPLADGQREVDLYLPVREVTLRVHSNVYRLRTGQQAGKQPPLAEHQFTPEPGKTNRVEIQVAAPPEIDEDSKDDKDAPKPAQKQVLIRKR